LEANAVYLWSHAHEETAHGHAYGRAVARRRTDRIESAEACVGDRGGRRSGKPAAQEADAVVYGIQYEDDERGYPGRNGMSALEKLFEPTGGRTFRVSRKMPLSSTTSEKRCATSTVWGSGRPPMARRVSSTSWK
jgi:hypothetical protein